MKNTKMTIATIALILTLTFAAALISLPAVNAQVITHFPTFIYVVAAPDPVGLGQSVNIVYWTAMLPMPGDDDPLLGAPGLRECWTGVTLTLTKPDGTKQTITMGPSDAVGGGYYIFVPDVAGTYSVQAHFPGQWKNRTSSIPYGLSTWRYYGAGSYYFESADSEIVEFVVQQEPIESWPGAELPTEYWTRPIDARLREWSTIAGNWLADGKANPYTTGPETAHIVWTEPQFFGGIAGEPFGHISISEGTSYQAKWTGVVIMLGRLYYNVPLSDSTSSSHRKVVCRDLRTGELLWEVNGTSISMGTIYEYWSRNQHGVHPYLWTSDNRVLDPFSGSELFRYTDVPRGSAAVGPDGERLIYVFGGSTGSRWLALWNFSEPVSMRGGPIGTSFDQWRPVGKIHNGSTAYTWNISIPDLPPSESRDFQTVICDADGVPEMLLCSSGAIDRWLTADPFTVYALSLEPERRGQLLWTKDYKLPFANATIDPNYGMLIDQESRVFALPVKQTMQWYGYDLDSGEQLWGPTASQPPYDYYRMTVALGDGKFYTGGYAGIVYAYDCKTGRLLWTAPLDECGLEGPYERWPISSIAFIDGKLYVNTGEHSHTHPLYRGWSMYCFDAETGAPIWNMTGIWQSFAFADGYIASLNLMDIQVYVFGKGPTATTVTASPKSSVQGTSVLIEGMVTDESPGTKEYALTARFPNGVPAIADEYMTEWMDYVYKQHEMPTVATGVPVTLDAIDPNGNFISIGRVTSDMSGFYSLMWEPETEGKYTIIATFEGSDSYYCSYAETAIGVDPAPSPAGPIEPEPAEAPLITTEVAIIAAVAVAVVIGIAAYWQLRKRQ